MTLYQWILLLHILFAFLFFFVYGISMATAFLLLNEKDVKQISILLNVPRIAIALMGLSMLGLLGTSIYMGSVANWWSRGWWGASFLIFLVMIFWMTWYGRKYYGPIRKELGLFYVTGFNTRNDPVENKAVNMDEVQRLIAKSNPVLLVSVGVIVTAVLVFLMRFKPL